MILRRSLVAIAFALFALMFQGARAQTDPLLTDIAQFSSTSVQTRAAAFYNALALGDSALTGVPSMSNKIQALMTLYPADVSQLASGLSNLLMVENTDPTIGTLMSSSDDESGVDFYLDLVEAVSVLNDPTTTPALLGAISSGAVVTNRLASFGPSVIDSVAALTYSKDFQTRDGAAFTLATMLRPPYSGSYGDTTSHSKIHAALVHALHRHPGHGPLRKVVESLPPVRRGDLNGDGVVSCADLRLVAAALGKKVGESGFDVRADLTGHGRVTWHDLNEEGESVAKALGLVHFDGDHDRDDRFSLEKVLKSCHIKIKGDHDHDRDDD